MENYTNNGYNYQNNQNNQQPYGNQPNQVPQNNQAYYQPPVQPEDNSAKNLATASLVLGIVSFFCCGFVTGVLGLIFGIMSRSRKKDDNSLATAGIIVSAIALGLWLIGIIFYFAFAGSLIAALDSPYYYY